MAATVHHLSPDDAHVRGFCRELRTVLTDLNDNPLSEDTAADVVRLLVHDAGPARDALARLHDAKS